MMRTASTLLLCLACLPAWAQSPPAGSWGWAFEGDDPLRRALDNCNRNPASKGECRLYSVGDYVVWSPE